MDLCNIQIFGLRNYFDKIQGENWGRVILSTTKSYLEKLDSLILLHRCLYWTMCSNTS